MVVNRLSLFVQPKRIAPLRVASRSHTVRAAMTQPLTVYVKGDPKTGKLLDCPFCHRVLLALEHKKIPYKSEYIDFANKPEWLQMASGGKVPVIKEGADGAYMPDSDVIVAHLEAAVPSPSMAPKAPKELGAKLFPSFRGYLLGPAAEQAAKQAELGAELQALNDYLERTGGPFFGGTSIDDTDAAVAPKLYHCMVALKHFKGWSLPAELTALSRYMDAVSALPEWKATDYGHDAIIAGWTRHMAQPH